jgi:hypothetical protein
VFFACVVGELVVVGEGVHPHEPGLRVHAADQAQPELRVEADQCYSVGAALPLVPPLPLVGAVADPSQEV